MERVAWWKCLIVFYWCIADDVADSAEKKKKEADKKAEIQSYVGQCECKYD